MDVFPVCVGGDNKSIFSLGKAHFLQFGKPLAEPPDALGDGSCTEKENKADELGHQQDKKLIPSLAVGGVDAAAEDVEHQRSNYITGQG